MGMLPILASALLAQSPAAPTPEVITVPQQVRPLPGSLDTTPMFNSNSPEVVQQEGILLSTFPKQGKAHPEAHLEHAFSGRFDVFAHHIAKALSPEDLRTLYLGVMIHNPGTSPVRLDVLQAASYLSQPDAPFIKLEAMADNSEGKVYAGPGDRVTQDILRGRRQASWPAVITLPPGESRMLLNVPIPVRELDPPINGRSTLARLRSSGPVHVASLAMFAKTTAAGEERAPTLEEWITLLQRAAVAGPRDKVPTPPGQPGQLIYGRVAGVAQGSKWTALVVDSQNEDRAQASAYRLTIPAAGSAFSYPLSSLDRGTFGTGQIQTAPLVKRYPDTAYAAHGNYGVEYQLTLPLYNPTPEDQTVTVHFQTALKTDEKKAGLEFRNPPTNRVFYRGTVRVRFQDHRGTPRTRYTHLVQMQGQQGDPLVSIPLKPQQKSLVQVNFIYPPDATPPQVLTVRTEP